MRHEVVALLPRPKRRRPVPRRGMPAGSMHLHLAASEGEVGRIERLVRRHGVDPRDCTGATPLHAACREGRSASVRMLLDRGADPGARTRWEVTPLLLAASALSPLVTGVAARRGGPGRRTGPGPPDGAAPRRYRLVPARPLGGARHRGREGPCGRASPRSRRRSARPGLGRPHLGRDVPPRAPPHLYRVTSPPHGVDDASAPGRHIAVPEGHTAHQVWLTPGFPMYATSS